MLRILNSEKSSLNSNNINFYVWKVLNFKLKAIILSYICMFE